MIRKAQAALEFLTTYGWAIMVVLGMVAALSYFGVISPDEILPEKCQFGPGLGCVEFGAEATGSLGQNFRLRLQNNFGYTIELVNTSLTTEGIQSPWQCFDCTAGNNNCSLVYELGTITQNPFWKADEIREFVGICELGPSEQPKMFIEITYKKGGGNYIKQIRGEALVKPVDTS